jgi:preprotein translocase subunit SecE
MKPPGDKAVVYTIAVIVCAVIVWIIFAVVALLFGL